MSEQILIALLLSVGVVALALWRGWLSRSGGLAAMLVGTLTMGLGGWLWGVLLGVFFVSSSLLSKFKDGEKKATAEEKFAKGHRRDAGQVFANGALGALLAVLSYLLPSSLWLYGFVGVMATVNADTWATELGTLSKRPPRLITTGKVVERGVSGGVSTFGTVATFCGGLLIGLFAAVWLGDWWWLAVGGLGGLVGSLVDSWLGATVQIIFWDDVKEKETEQRMKYGREMAVLRGWGWMTNDVVNLVASMVGGGVGVLVGLVV